MSIETSRYAHDERIGGCHNGWNVDGGANTSSLRLFPEY